jgi:sugar phosphate isomerase/epimerase
MPTHQLLFGHTLWGLIGLNDPPEDGISRLAPAGYQVFEAGPQVLGQPGWKERLAEARLLPVVQWGPMEAEDGPPAYEVANRIGALMLNAHCGSPRMDEAVVCDLLNALYDSAEAARVKLVVETHRGRVTQDLYRLARLCGLVPRLRLNLDVSHICLCEERPGPTADLAPLLDQVLDRVDMIHGRICNGEQIQVDAGDGSGELPQRYLHLWAEAMRRWRLRSPAGAVFVFTPELGPANYAIFGRDGAELTDRWEQSLVIREIGSEAWKLSAGASGTLWP